MSRQPTARAGKTLGRYRIERELGRGGMGVVYVAQDTNTGRLVALKTTAVAALGGGSTQRNQRRQRFVREVQALTQVNHENVVHVFDAGEADDADLGWLLFYSMEFIDGLTLAQLVQQRGALDAAAAAAVVMQIASGLGAAHERGIVHRDVKPANIFISMNNRALIGDFGICKIEGSTQITRRDQLVGTPNYLAPEQILGDDVSPATDVFALGALFYIITMNRPLRSHVDPASLMQSAQGDDAKHRMLADGPVPLALRRVLARALERDPQLRWQDGNDLAEALAEHASQVPTISDDTLADPLKGATSTGERSNPFSSLRSLHSDDVASVDERDQQGDGANAVEEAALALLGEVDKQFPRPGDAGTHRTAQALPVARTESTVMFNLRALEAEQHASLPVAKTESTAIFNISQASPNVLNASATEVDDVPRLRSGATRDQSAQPATHVRAIDAEARRAAHAGDTADEFVREATNRESHNAPPSADTTQDATWRPSRDQTAANISPYVVRVPVLERVRLAWHAAKDRLVELPRGARLLGAAASGMVLGVAVAVAFTPSAPPRAQAAPTARNGELTLQRRPALCPDDVEVTESQRSQAASLTHEAIAIVAAKGGAPQEAIQKLKDAVRGDPYAYHAFYELAQLLVDAPAKQNDAYVCTCLIAEGSTECKNVKRVLGVVRFVLP